MQTASDVSELTMPTVDQVTQLMDKLNADSAKVYNV